MNAAHDKCLRVCVSLSQMLGLNSVDSVQWDVCIQSLPESEGKGKGKDST